VVERSNGRAKQLHEKIGVDERLTGRRGLISQWSWSGPEAFLIFTVTPAFSRYSFASLKL